MNKIPFENGTLVTPAKVNEDNTITPAVYEGTTPLSAHNLNLMQENIETEINDSSVIVSSTEPTGENRKKIWIKKGKNLINLKQKENGHISLENGLIDGYGNWYYFSLKVQSNTSYTFQINPTSTISYEIAYYDENNSFISGDWGDFNSNTKFRTITTPENCKNVKVAWSEDNGYNSLMFSQSNTETDYEEYIDKKIYVKNDNGVYEEFINTDEIKINNSSNENGNAIKFPDGTLIQYGSYNLGTINAHSGNYHTLLLPIPFVDTNYVATVTKMSGGSSGFAAVSDSIYRTSNSKIDFTHWNDSDTLADSFLVGWTAIGRWK